MRINKDKLQFAMAEKNISSQKALAIKAGLSANTVSTLARGAETKILSLCKIAAALNVEPKDLIED